MNDWCAHGSTLLEIAGPTKKFDVFRYIGSAKGLGNYVIELQILGAAAITTSTVIAAPDQQTCVVADSIIFGKNSGASVSLSRFGPMMPQLRLFWNPRKATHNFTPASVAKSSIAR